MCPSQADQSQKQEFEGILSQIPHSSRKPELSRFLTKALSEPAYFGDSVEAFEERLRRVVDAKIPLASHESYLRGSHC